VESVGVEGEGSLLWMLMCWGMMRSRIGTLTVNCDRDESGCGRDQEDKPARPSPRPRPHHRREEQ